MAEGGLLYWRRQRPDGTKYQDFEELLRPLPPPPVGLMWVKTRIVVAEGEEEEEEEEEEEDQDEGEEEATSAAAQNEREEQQENDGGGGLPIATPVEGGEEAGADEAPRRTRPPRCCVTRWKLVERVAVGKGGGDNDEGGQGGSGGNGQEGEKEDDDMLEGEDDGEGRGLAFLTHTVLPTDTVQGLRLRYKVTPAELRLHNDFAGEQFHMLQTLKIPLKQNVVSHVAKFRQRPTQAVLRQRFTNATRCTDEQEINYYLESAEWKLSVALTEYQEDRAWEEAHHAHVQMACLLGPPSPISIEAASAAAAAAAAVGGTAPAAFSSNAMLRTSVSHESTPPPSYSSFFRVPRRGAEEKKKKKKKKKKGGSGGSGYLSSWSAFGGGKKKANKAVYDMGNVIAEDYVILPGAEGEEEGGVDGDDGDEEGSVAASLLSSSTGGVGGGAVAMVTGEEDHPQTPLLARAAMRG